MKTFKKKLTNAKYEEQKSKKILFVSHDLRKERKMKTAFKDVMGFDDRLLSLEEKVEMIDDALLVFTQKINDFEEKEEELEKKMENTEDAVRMLLDDRYWEKPDTIIKEKI
jgi:hypothetical protein